MNHIYAINTHHKYPQLLAEYWSEDGVCAVGHNWSYEEEYPDPDKPPTGEWGLFPEIYKGDIILAYASDNMIAYVGKVADSELRTEKKNDTGRIYKYWNQRKVTWWTEPNHFHREDLPRWISKQFPRRGKTIIKLDLKGHTFKEAKSVIKTSPRSGSAFASLNEEMVKAGLRNYFLSHAHVFERGLKIRMVEKEVARGHRPDFEGQDAKRTPVIIECKGSATTTSCDQLTRYGKKHHKDKTPRRLLVAFRFEEACRKAASKAGIELFRCGLKLIREKGISRN